MFSRLRAACGCAVARLAALPPAQLVAFGYLSYILIGCGLLCLPWSQQQDGATALDHLFTAASAVSTTGLVTVSTSDSYSWWGELIVLILIQLGGLGYMTISSFTILAWTGQLSPFRERIAGTSMQFPAHFELRQFLRLIVSYTLILELLGALCLFPLFARAGAPNPVWQAVFHSISAFCTAGFGLFNNSLEDYRDSVGMNLVMYVLSCSGAIGFIVVQDLWRSLRSREVQLTFTSRIILWSTCLLLGVGTLLYCFIEPSVRQLAWPLRIQASLFQVMTASTTVGFNTMPIGALAPATVCLLLLLMLIGASPAGTGGGLKTTTITAVWAVLLSVLRQRPSITLLGRAIPDLRIRTAIASLLFYLITLGTGVFLLAVTEQASLADLQFEAASALGTVGLSRGITGSLTTSGKLTVILLMYLGRVGPLSLALAFWIPRNADQSRLAEHLAEEDVVL